jgi:hypothetical protein
MALKGARTIVVREQTFKWKALHPSMRYFETSPRNMDIIVHAAEGHGKLRAAVCSDVWDEKFEADYEAGLESHKASVTPADTRLIIEKALDDGWEPAERGQHELAGPLKLTDYSVIHRIKK